MAISMVEGPERGLELVSALEAQRELRDYPLLAAARADMLRRGGRWPEAAEVYHRALAVAGNDGDRAVLKRRLQEVQRQLGSHVPG